MPVLRPADVSLRSSIIQSPFAPFPLQKPLRYYGLIRESLSPVEFRI